MHSAVKLIIGLLIAIAGIYWYAADYIAVNPASTWLGLSALAALKQVFIGVFGLFLIFVGLIIAWIEYEDLKWQAREAREAKKQKRKKA
jgi:amino acid transporter